MSVSSQSSAKTAVRTCYRSTTDATDALRKVFEDCDSQLSNTPPPSPTFSERMEQLLHEAYDLVEAFSSSDALGSDDISSPFLLDFQKPAASDRSLTPDSDDTLSQLLLEFPEPASSDRPPTPNSEDTLSQLLLEFPNPMAADRPPTPDSDDALSQLLLEFPKPADPRHPPRHPYSFLELPQKVRMLIITRFLSQTEGSLGQLKAHIYFCPHRASDLTLLPFWAYSVTSSDARAFQMTSKQVCLEMVYVLLPQAICRVSLCDFTNHHHTSLMRDEQMQHVKKLVVESDSWRLAYQQYAGGRAHWLSTRMMHTLKYLDLDVFGLEADPESVFGQDWRLSTAQWHQVHEIEATFSHQLGTTVRLVRVKGQAMAGQKENLTLEDQAYRRWMEREMNRLVLLI